MISVVLNQRRLLLFSSLVILMAILLTSAWGHFIIYLCGVLASVIIGGAGYLFLRIRFSSKFRSVPVFPTKVAEFQRSILESLTKSCIPVIEARNRSMSGATSANTPSPLISRSIDQQINEVIDELLDSYVFSWLRPLICPLPNAPLDDNDSEVEIRRLIRRDIWVALQNLSERLSRVDAVNLLCNNLVRRLTQHFEKVRLAQQQGTPPPVTSNGANQQQRYEGPVFHIWPHLVSQEREEEFLIKMSEILIAFLLPTSYSKCAITRHLLKEILGKKLFYPTIDKVTNPDFVNTQIVFWINRQGSRSTNPTVPDNGSQKVQGIGLSKGFDYSASHDDFLSSIASAIDEEALKHLRFNILTEIVQATQLNHLNLAKGKSTGEPVEVDSVVPHVSSDEKLKKYINQLGEARSLCEKRLSDLQCVNQSGRDNIGEIGNGSNDELLSFKAIMNSPMSRRYFYKYLESLAPSQQDLLGFWSAVEELKESNRTQWHQLATEIFYTYINKPNGVIRVRKNGLKKIEEFLLGDAKPCVFYEIQGDVLRTLEEKHFSPFLASGMFQQLLKEAQETGIILSEPVPNCSSSKIDEEKTSPSDEVSSETSLIASEAVHFSDQSSFAKSQLEHVTERLQNKMQALKALRSSLKPDSKVLKMLQGEINFLEEDRHQMEQHLSRTEAWSEHLGNWRCHIQSVEHIEEQECLQVVLIVHVPIDNSKHQGQLPPSWVCTRQIGEFHTLHQNLTPYVSWIKGMDLPSSPKSIFGGGRQTSKTWQEKARATLQNYLDSVLVDDRLNQSEIVYSFLSPSPDYLKTASSLPPSMTRSTPRKGSEKRPRKRQSLHRQQQKFTSSLSSLFRHTEVSTEGSSDTERLADNTSIFNGKADNSGASFIRTASGESSAHDEDDHFWSDDFDSSRNLEDGGDAIAEPLNALIGEVFDMRGVFKILRKSLIAVVQMTYSVSVSRQLRDTVSWLTSEHMIVNYIQSLRDACSRPREEEEQKSQEEVFATRKEAQDLLIQHLPELLVNLVGQQAARNGTVKVFDCLQEQMLNKQLFYDFLEHLLNELFPELLVTHAE